MYIADRQTVVSSLIHNQNNCTTVVVSTDYRSESVHLFLGINNSDLIWCLCWIIVKAHYTRPKIYNQCVAKSHKMCWKICSFFNKYFETECTTSLSPGVYQYLQQYPKYVWWEHWKHNIESSDSIMKAKFLRRSMLSFFISVSQNCN